MLNRTTDEAFTHGKIAGNNVDAGANDAGVSSTVKNDVSAEKPPASKVNEAAPGDRPPQPTKTAEIISNGRQSQAQQHPTTAASSPIQPPRAKVHPEVGAAASSPKPAAQANASMPHIPITGTTAASSSVVIDPAEAAAAAFNQPIQYVQSNQYIPPSGMQPMSLSQIPSAAQGSLYVGDLDEDVTEGQLYEVFSPYGVIVNIRVCKDLCTRRSLGYAYVNFHNLEDAAKALCMLNYHLLKDRPMRIMWIQRDPAIRKVGTGNVYIKNLDPTIDTRSLHETFKVFGKIMSCKVVCDDLGSKGYGYIHFENPEDAAHAIDKVNGMLINERKVYVGPHIQKKDRLSKQDEIKLKFNNVYVKNLPDDTTEEMLREMFEKFGEVTSVAISTDNEGKFRGFGFVCFQDCESANLAVDEMHNKTIGDKNLYVTRAQKRAEREQKLKEQYELFKEEKMKKYKNVNLYIKNLDDSITDDRLNNEFKNFGVITSAKVMRDEKTGGSKGFGFVCFSSPEEATKAVTEMNGRIVVSKPIYVALAQCKDARRAHLAALMNKNRLRAQQVSHIPDIYRPAPMIYHPQGFAYQPQNGASYFPRGDLMRPRWMTPHQQIHSPTPISGPVYLAPMGPQAASQQRPQRQMHAGQHRVPPGPVGAPSGRQVPPGAVPLADAAMSARKPPPMQGFVATPPAASSMAPFAARPGPNARPMPPRGQHAGPGAAPQHQDGPVPPQMPPIVPLVLDPELFAAVPLDQQKRVLGEALFSAVHLLAPKVEAKVTGMLLELGNEEIIEILRDPPALRAKVQEAVRALDEHNKRQQQQKKIQHPQHQQRQGPSRTQQPVVASSASGPIGGLEVTEASS